MLKSLRPTLSLPAPFTRLHRLLRLFRLNFDNSYDAMHQHDNCFPSHTDALLRLQLVIIFTGVINEVLVLFFFIEG